MFHLIFSHNILPRQHHVECTAQRELVTLMVARLEPINLPFFVFQTIRTEAQSTSREGLPYGVMLTHLMLDAEIAVRHHEPTSMQLGPINNAVEEMERHIIGALEKVVAPVITNVAAIKERLNEIMSRQLELKKAQENDWEDIKQRIDDVEEDLMKEMKNA
ncbi:hypothetical protein CJ030_MR7G000067 [Morella rubra]|uniref:Uncharacterized protein n=1 Tax=Morella rubra TaxID=262757 RepID=A0A6A1V3Q9_9ROSI|nr:hypothetical protein CJ030_MR7G000067 [Morella rubra]